MTPSQVISSLVGSYNVRVSTFPPNPGTQFVLCKANPQRWALLISSVSGIGYNVGPAGIDLSQFGINGSIASLPVEITNRDFPGLPQQQWEAFSGGAVNILLIEIIAIQ